MKTAILITRPVPEVEKHEISRLTNLDGQVDVLCAEGMALDQQAAKEVALDADLKRKVNYDVFKDILQFGDRAIGPSTFSQYFSFDKAQLWHYHKFRIYFNTRNLAYEYELIKKVATSYDKVIVYTARKDLGLLDMDWQKVELVLGGSKKATVRMATVLHYAATFVVRVVVALFTSPGLKGKKGAVIDSRDQYRRILKADGSGFVLENAYLGYAFPLFDRQFVFIDQLVLPKFSGTFKLNATYWKNLNNRPRIYGEYIVLRWLGLRGIKAIWRFRKMFKQKIQSFEAAHTLSGFDSAIFEQFKSLSATSLFYFTKYTAYSHFFRKSRLKVVATTDENSPNFKLILDAAKAHGITTVGYQHGSIHDLHPAYMYSNTEVERQQPMPDHTLVWGGHWKTLLHDLGNYPEEHLKVIGQIRTDVIHHLKSKSGPMVFDQEDRLQGHKMVLFASQPQRDPALRHRAARDVMHAVKNIGQALLVIKLHPYEKDTGYYEKIARETGIKNFLIMPDTDLYLLLRRADAVVTCFSTVGTEAIYFKKPLVILDHLKQDVLHYKKEGVAFQASNSDELHTFIKGILEGTHTLDQSIYDRYIEKYAFKIDGLAGKRLVDFMKARM